MDFVKEWKEKEVKSILEGAEEYKSKLHQLDEAENKAKDNLETAKREYFERTGEVAILERLTPVTKGYKDENLNKLYKIKENAHEEYWDYRNSNAFYRDYAWSKDIEERVIKLVDKHFNSLQVKVEKKIGTIIKITSLGGDDYRFEGTEGNCKIEVILAGGYNIQRLHTRWIVKK